MEPKIDLDNYIKFDDLKDDHMGGCEFGPASIDTITLSSLNYSNTVIGGGLSYPNVTMASSGVYTTGTSPYTISGGAGNNTSPWATGAGSYTFPSTVASPQIQLAGEGADIKINDWSLVDAVKKIEERLNILHPNTKLEAEWEELRALGNKYRELEQHIKDKQATWDRLKAMPPPVID